MATQKILNLIPESLQQTLIDEVKELLKEQDNKSQGEIDPSIKAYIEKKKNEQVSPEMKGYLERQKAAQSKQVNDTIKR